MSATRIAMNVIAYQFAWFACVLGAAAGRPGIGILAATAVVAGNVATSRTPSRELPLIAVAVTVGALFESLLLATGWIRMSPDAVFASTTPLWMVALWGVFATTLNVSLRALRNRQALSAVLGAVGAPLAYLAGARLGALQWVDMIPALLLIGLGWAVLTPLLMVTARRYDGYAT